jgi:hypothetical protein
MINVNETLIQLLIVFAIAGIFVVVDRRINKNEPVVSDSDPRGVRVVINMIDGSTIDIKQFDTGSLLEMVEAYHNPEVTTLQVNLDEDRTIYLNRAHIRELEINPL